MAASRSVQIHLLHAGLQPMGNLMAAEADEADLSFWKGTAMIPLKLNFFRTKLAM